MSDRILNVIRNYPGKPTKCHECGAYRSIDSIFLYELHATGFDFPGVYCHECAERLASVFKLKIEHSGRGV